MILQVMQQQEGNDVIIYTSYFLLRTSLSMHVTKRKARKYTEKVEG